MPHSIMRAPAYCNAPAFSLHAGRCPHRLLRKTPRRRRAGNAAMRSASAPHSVHFRRDCRGGHDRPAGAKHPRKRNNYRSNNLKRTRKNNPASLRAQRSNPHLHDGRNNAGQTGGCDPPLRRTFCARIYNLPSNIYRLIALRAQRSNPYYAAGSFPHARDTDCFVA